MERKNLEMILVLKINALEPLYTNSHNPEEDTCHWQSLCYQVTLRVKISLKEIFSKSGFLRLMKKQDESTLMHVLQEFGTL